MTTILEPSPESRYLAASDNFARARRHSVSNSFFSACPLLLISALRRNPDNRLKLG